jgi:hypothetical protein
MKTATWLTLLAVGAILAFAVRTSPPGLNINVVGWIIMLTGAAGFLLSRRASGWVRRRVLMRTGSAVPVSGQPGDTRHPLDDASYPLDDGSHPLDDASYPLDDGSHPTDDLSYPLDDASYPLDDASYPLDDLSYPLDDGSHPTDDLSYPLDDASYPLDDLSYPLDDLSYPLDDASYPLDDGSRPTGDASYPQFVLRDPAALASAILRDAELAGTPDDSPQTAAGLTATRPDGGWADPEPVPFDELLQGRTGRGNHWQ